MNAEHDQAEELVQTAGRAPALQAVDAVVLYDPRTGRIVHVHQVLTFEGAPRKSPEEQQERAREAARHLGHDVEGTEVLHIPEFRLAARAYRVDTGTRTLIEEPLPPRKRAVRPRAKRATKTKGPAAKKKRAAKKTGRRAGK